MNIFNFIVKSGIFKWVFILTGFFIIFIYIINKVFDSNWKNKASIPLNDLSIFYNPPEEYNDFKKINLMLINKKDLAIEGNKKFRVSGKQKYFDYFDTISIKYPLNESELMDSIYIEFQNSEVPDTILLNITKSAGQDIYWNQVFYSSVIIENLNSFSSIPKQFQLDELSLIDRNLLKNNDTLINNAIRIYEIVKKINFDCGYNSRSFKKICDSLNLPCRTIGMQGGDASEKGYDNLLGYPLHAVCEIYSSRYKKWYVIDPTFGFRFKNGDSGIFLNAVEIQDIYYSNREHLIYQDSILTTFRKRAGSSYFKYYENIYYSSGIIFNEPWLSLMALIYKRFQYYQYHYTKNLLQIKNGYYYIILKSLVYISFTFLYFIAVILVLTYKFISVYRTKV